MNFKPWYSLLLLLILVGCSSTSNAEGDSAAVPPELAYVNELRGAVVNPPREIDDFTFASASGEDFTLSDHRGEVVLLYFGYMTCPDVCPATFADLRRVYTELGEPADEVKVVFLTVDPERDTLERLALYTNAFHEDFIGLWGEGDALNRVLDDFGVVATKREVKDSALGYLVDHTTSVFLIGPDGRLQEVFLFGTDYQDIAHDIQVILDHQQAS